MVCQKKVRDKRDKRDKSLLILCRFLVLHYRFFIFFVFFPLPLRWGKESPCGNVRTKRIKLTKRTKSAPFQFPKKSARKAR
jgi:hypothetical protein